MHEGLPKIWEKYRETDILPHSKLLLNILIKWLGLRHLLSETVRWFSMVVLKVDNLEALHFKNKIFRGLPNAI